MNYGETIKTWSIDLDNKKHTFRFEHQFWTGRKKYFVNNELIKHVRGGLFASASFKDEAHFTIGSHKGKFKFSARGSVFPHTVLQDDMGSISNCHLFINENKITGSKKQALRAPKWVNTVLIAGLITIFLFAKYFKDLTN